VKTTCPHCGETIELVGAQELKQDFGLTDNMLQYAQKRGKMPRPWLKFNNRGVWLRRDAEAFISERNREKIKTAAATLSKSMTGLSREEQEEMLRILQEQISPSSGRRRSR
jgi:hypothetical protein